MTVTPEAAGSSPVDPGNKSSKACRSEGQQGRRELYGRVARAGGGSRPEYRRSGDRVRCARALVNARAMQGFNTAPKSGLDPGALVNHGSSDSTISPVSTCPFLTTIGPAPSNR